MRRLILASCILSAVSASGMAQDLFVQPEAVKPPTGNFTAPPTFRRQSAPVRLQDYEPATPARRRPVQAYAPRRSNEQILQQRELFFAKQRAARIQMRKFEGVSPARPNIRAGHYSVDLNRGAFAPWAAYRTPIWYGGLR